MKKNLTIFVAVLLLLCVLTAALKITQRDKDGGLFGFGAITGGLNNNISSNEDEKEYSWVDPYTGIDIFAYKNLFSFKEGDAAFISSGDAYSANGLVLHADESVDIPSTVGGVEIDQTQGFVGVFPGFYDVKPGYTYYAYYARELGGTWYPMGINSGSMREPGTENELSYELGLGTSYIYVDGEMSDYHVIHNSSFGWSFSADVEGTLVLSVVPGYQSGSYFVNTGTFYVRLIAVQS